MMRVTTDRAELAEATAWCLGAISKNPPSPVLAGFRLRVERGLLAISAFDFDQLRQTVVSAEGDDLDTIVSARFLTQIVAALRGSTVTLELVDGRLAVTSERSTYRAQVMDPADYPELPAFPTHVGTIDAGALADLLGTVEHAVSKDPGMKALAAYNVVGEAGLLTVTTTDRFRMARATSKWADASAATFEVNVPGTALHTGVKSLRGDVQIGATDGLFGLSDAGRVIITRVLGSEDRFPKVGPIFAREPVTHVQVDVASLAEALKRSLLVADETGMVFVEFSDELITITGDGKTSDGTEEVDTDPGFGEGESRYKFNAAFLGQALAACPSPRVLFGLIAEGKQVLIEPVGVDSVDLIVMPRSAS